jgi:hypothetical protein
MEEVVERENLQAALRRVRQNKGSPGIDGMTTEELLPYLRESWARIREQLLAGTYQPAPVKRQEIPKKGGGIRQLGIPTVLDAAPSRLWRRRSRTWRKAGATWWTWIWSSSSTASTTMC